LRGVGGFRLVHFVGDAKSEKVRKIQANHVIPIGPMR
jgi:hypothetical protein